MKILWFLLLLLARAVDSKNEKRGPYRTILHSIKRCQNSTYPLQKDPSILVDLFTTKTLEINTSHLLNGNVSVLSDTKQVRMKIKSLLWTGGKWKLTYVMNGVNCHSMVMELISKAISFTMFDANCVLMKGKYNFRGLDINTILHRITTDMEYGQTLWRNELSVGLFTYNCWELLTMVVKI